MGIRYGAELNGSWRGNVGGRELQITKTINQMPRIETM
jgi:hypothetical protein